MTLWSAFFMPLRASLWASDAAKPETNTDEVRKSPETRARIAQLVAGKAVRRQYPFALTTLIATANQRTTLNLAPQPALISSFEDPAIFDFPFIYANFADRKDWTLSALERKNLKDYLERGGFLYVDAGINAEFLREDVMFGQHHSFAEWDASPELKKAFRGVFPDKRFQPLERSHHLYASFNRGLPDPSRLPDTVRDFVVHEKWPEGTYSAVALTVNGRIAVLATPIVAMGWGKDPLGNWVTNIKFRIREGAEGLSERLRTAAYSGARFETVREDGRQDVIFCQKQALPAWVREPEGNWRVFRYYYSREISDFAHVFYTRFGLNILIYAFSH